MTEPGTTTHKIIDVPRGRYRVYFGKHGKVESVQVSVKTKRGQHWRTLPATPLWTYLAYKARQIS